MSDSAIYLRSDGYQQIAKAIGGEHIDVRMCFGKSEVTWAYANPEIPKRGGIQYHFTRAHAEAIVPELNKALAEAGVDTAVFEIHPKKYDFADPDVAKILESLDNRSLFTRAARALGLSKSSKDAVFIDLMRVENHGFAPSVWTK